MTTRKRPYTPEPSATNASGQRTANGAEFTGQNILRDYRAWAKKTGTADE